VISFGVAPATLAYAAGLRGGWDWIILIYFVCCGVSRLARFNVTAEKLAGDSASGKVKYFEGTPIPTSVVLTGVLALEAWRGCVERGELDGGVFTLGPWDLHLLTLLFALSGSLMISKTLADPQVLIVTPAGAIAATGRGQSNRLRDHQIKHDESARNAGNAERDPDPEETASSDTAARCPSRPPRAPSRASGSASRRRQPAGAGDEEEHDRPHDPSAGES
jgi:hypothetical protein